MADKPVFKPEWATDDAVLPEAGTDNKIRPTEELRLTGYDYKQKPTAQEFNWILNNVFEWIEYLESITDAVGITDIASQAEAEAGSINTAIMTPLRTKQYSDQFGIGGSKRLTGNNMNDLVRSGFYYVTSSLNLPAGNTEGHVIVTGTGVDGEVMQRFTASEDIASNDFHNAWRIKNAAGTWTSWRALNSGTPSTLSTTSITQQDVNGHSHEVNLASFFDNTEVAGNQLIAGNGYQKLPGGLIIQWGKATVGDNNIVTVNLPIAFPTAGLSVTAMPVYGSSVNNDDVLSCHGTIVNNSQIKIGMSRNVVITTNGVYWMAIGY